MPEEQNFSEEIVNSVNRIKNRLKLLQLVNKAKLEYSKNNYEGCEEACKSILATEPKNIDALRGLGCVLLSGGDKEGALSYYKKSLEYSNDKETDYALLGTVYYLYDELEMAVECFNKAIDINENYDFAYEGRNQSMLEQHLKVADLQDRLVEKWKIEN